MDVRLHVNNVLKLYGCVFANEHALVRYSLLFSSEIILTAKTIIRLRLGEYCRIIVK